MKAYCLIRAAPHYRHDAFHAGLAAAGFDVIPGPAADPSPADVLVIWNRYGTGEAQAQMFERVGASVLVVENGYFGADADGRQFYAIAHNGHNGSGRWFPGDGSRWAALGLDLAPWQENPDGHILVAGQRGIGTPLMASPRNWHLDTAATLRRHTKRDILVREHPGQNEPARPLAEDLAGAFAVVVWSSAVAGKALMAGIPVFAAAPHHVLEGALQRGYVDIDRPAHPSRRPAFERAAWAQWNLGEIERGDPFRHLLFRAG